jgi:hypothetical protein
MKVGDLVYALPSKYFGVFIERDKHGILWVCPLGRNGIFHERCIPRQVIRAHMTFIGPIAVLNTKELKWVHRNL